MDNKRNSFLMDILCINDKFSTDVLEFYKVHKVVTPKKDSFYVIRNTIRHTTGEIGILLEEMINPKVPVKHPILGVTQMEYPSSRVFGYFYWVGDNYSVMRDNKELYELWQTTLKR